MFAFLLPEVIHTQTFSKLLNAYVYWYMLYIYTISLFRVVCLVYLFLITEFISICVYSWSFLQVHIAIFSYLFNLKGVNSGQLDIYNKTFLTELITSTRNYSLLAAKQELQAGTWHGIKWPKNIYSKKKNLKQSNIEHNS